MVWIKYRIVQSLKDGEPIFANKKIAYKLSNLEIAQAEAYDGYEIVDDGESSEEVKALPIYLGGTGSINEIGARRNLEVAQAIESENTPGCFYRQIDGELEWVNPPMIEGIEYRTTERNYGNVIYTKLVDIGTIASGDSGNFKFTDGNAYPIRCSAYTYAIKGVNGGSFIKGNTTLPRMNGLAELDVQAWDNYISFNFEQGSSDTYKVQVQVWYTKETI